MGNRQFLILAQPPPHARVPPDTFDLRPLRRMPADGSNTMALHPDSIPSHDARENPKVLSTKTDKS
jgi:hypothetical protein